MPNLTNKTHQKKTILITGGTSGIGYQSVIALINKGYKVILICRNQQRVSQVLIKLRKDLNLSSDLNDRLDLRIADLSDLSSVENLCNQLLSEITSVHTIVLNAGLQYTGAKDPIFSKQGVELTFAVNHMAHQYLIQRLYKLLPSDVDSRVVITSSEVHNPSSAGGRVGDAASLGELYGLRSIENFSMIDGSSVFSADKAYKDTKLCNILFGKELFEKLTMKGLRITVNCWAPGLVIPREQDGFFRYSRKYNEFGQRLFAFIARDLLHITESPQKAGEILMNLSTSEEYLSYKFNYYSNTLNFLSSSSLKQLQVSSEAQDINKAKNLWKFTNNLISKNISIEELYL